MKKILSISDQDEEKKMRRGEEGRRGGGEGGRGRYRQMGRGLSNAGGKESAKSPLSSAYNIQHTPTCNSFSFTVLL